MASYKDLQAQIENLQTQAAAAREKETATVIAQIHSVMAQYGITAADLGIRATQAKRKTSAVEPKYQDPATGATWTGRGRAPAWLADQDRAKFLIK